MEATITSQKMRTEFLMALFDINVKIQRHTDATHTKVCI